MVELGRIFQFSRRCDPRDDVVYPALELDCKNLWRNAQDWIDPKRKCVPRGLILSRHVHHYGHSHFQLLFRSSIYRGPQLDV